MKEVLNGSGKKHKHSKKRQTKKKRTCSILFKTVSFISSLLIILYKESFNNHVTQKYMFPVALVVVGLDLHYHSISSSWVEIFKVEVLAILLANLFNKTHFPHA